MPNKILIDATHPEETRVVVLRGNRVEEFDFESANRKQLRGNIYLAKVTRVEPSLQAAFVDYGGNRHGFLAFSEIHPDYYQIPVADRQALIAEEERAQKAADADADHRARGGRGRGRHRHRGADRNRDVRRSEPIDGQPTSGEALPSEGAANETVEIPASDTMHAEPLPEQTAETAAAEAAPTTAELDAQEEAREAYESPVGDLDTDAAPAADAGEQQADHADTGEAHAAEAADAAS